MRSGLGLPVHSPLDATTWSSQASASASVSSEPISGSAWRLRQMPYGRRLRQALPEMGSLDTEADALAWLDHVVASRGE